MTKTNLPLFQRSDVFISAGIFAVVLTIYIFTLSPSVYFGDSGELSAAAYNLGIAHPPGYPLYLLLGKIFMLVIPISSAAMKMNLLSAVFGALTAVIFYLINRLLNTAQPTAAAAALIAAFMVTFWTQAVVAEVYTLAAVFFGLMLLFSLLWLKDRKENKQKWLSWLALTCGLAMTHHVILGVFFPVILLFLLLNRAPLFKKPRLLVRLILLFLIPLLLYLYLPIRTAANPVNDWGDPEGLRGMIDHITARQFGGLFFKYGLEGVAYQFNSFLDRLWNQLPALLLLISLAGFIPAWRRDRRITLYLSALMITALAYSCAYFISDIEPHFIWVFLILSLFLGQALDFGRDLLQRTGKPIAMKLAIPVLVAITVWPVAANWHTCDRSGFPLARQYGVNLLHSLEKNGVLFIDSERELFLMAYLKIVENQRPDVDVYDLRQNIFLIPAMKVKSKDARKTVTIKDLYTFAYGLANEGRPVYFTNPVFGNFKTVDYGLLYRVITPNDLMKQKEGQAADAVPEFAKQCWESYLLEAINDGHPDTESRFISGKYNLGLARFFARRSRIDTASEFIDKALTAAGDNHEILKGIAMLYMQHNNQNLAEPLLKKAAKLYPFDPDIYNMLAMTAHSRQDYDGALANYNESIEKMPGNITVYMNRSMLYEQMADKTGNSSLRQIYYTKALKDLDRAEKLEPGNPAISQSRRRISSKRTQ